MEPGWEARFEPNSYGFRPGRSTHDAVGAIFRSIRIKPKYVLDADISKCFDRINHDALLRKFAQTPYRRLIKQWLKSGVFDNKQFSNTLEGTPHGGVISPKKRKHRLTRYGRKANGIYRKSPTQIPLWEYE